MRVSIVELRLAVAESAEQAGEPIRSWIQDAIEDVLADRAVEFQKFTVESVVEVLYSPREEIRLTSPIDALIMDGIEDEATTSWALAESDACHCGSCAQGDGDRPEGEDDDIPF